MMNFHHYLFSFQNGNIQNSSILIVCFCCRHANFSYAPPRHITDAGKCSSIMFLRIFYIWNSWCPVVARDVEAEVLSKGTGRLRLSAVSNFLIYIIIA